MASNYALALDNQDGIYERLTGDKLSFMRRYIRNYVEGGTFFFTLVTNGRNAFFCDSSSVEICLKALGQIQKFHPFELVAYCIMPDHLHLLISLPADQKDFSTIIKEFKKKVTKELKHQRNDPGLVEWQDRFWEHTIRDQRDFKTHFDYIHYNPIKHGFVTNLDDWKWSSFGDYYDWENQEKMAIDPKLFSKDGLFFGE
jgi:putative transposase